MSASVSLSRCTSYDRDAVLAALTATLGRLGGMGSYVRAGQKVLLKPSLLRPAPKETCVTTHPSIVWAVAKLAQEAGGTVYVGDSPGMGSGRRAMLKSGIYEVVEELGLEVADFAESVELEAPESHTFRRLEVARDVLDADVVISLPKVKTHGQMYLTAAVKNTFGCVVGARKAQWHMKAGRDTRYFARMLLDLYAKVHPALTIADGIVSMEGNGPGSGDPKATRFLLAGQDGVALDSVICALLQLPPEKLPTYVEAKGLGIGETELGRIEVLGEPLDQMRVSDFKPSRTARLQWIPLPAAVTTVLKNATTPKPRVVDERCVRCGQCIQACPPEAMRLVARRLGSYDEAVEIDHLTCIRCFCCQETCPEGAIVLHTGWLLSGATSVIRGGPS